MSKVYLLDCTLRDGGYVNDWNFGEETIRDFGRKIAQTGIEIFEVGFIKGDSYDPDRSLFPDIQSIERVIQPKSEELMYVGMLDLSAPIPLDRLVPCSGNSVDGIRVIFKKDKMKEAYTYCKRIKELGYRLFVNFVGTDSYTDMEFINGLNFFKDLHPFAVSIVDTFGMIKRKQFLRLCYLADNNLDEDIILAYHAHNNLQLAFGNAEAMVEMNLKRDISIDACVFGMGRGAGNLNMELFAEYMNENYGTSYRIEPMLEIMDEYLYDIYNQSFWGYSLPLYLSASNRCHPNYAIYLAKKDSLPVKAFNELLRGIPEEDKARFSKEKAEKYYRQYLESYLDDKAAIKALEKEFDGKEVLLLAPGKQLAVHQNPVKEKSEEQNVVTVAVNFLAEEFQPDYIFSSNMRRYRKIQNKTKAKCITTSNMQDCEKTDFVVNFASYAMDQPEIIDNSGLMLLKLLNRIGVKTVSIAGMDGYSALIEKNYYSEVLEYDFSKEAELRNSCISEEIRKLKETMNILFITPSNYEDKE